MLCLLLFVDVKLPFDHLVVGACRVAPLLYGPSRDRLGGQGQVYGQFAVFAASLQIVSGPVVMSNLSPVLVYSLHPKRRITLFPESRVPPSSVCVHVAHNYCSSSQSDGSVPVCLPRPSLSSL